MLTKKLLLAGISGFLSLAAAAQVRLPRLVSDSMILQRDKPVRIWGWSAAGEKITVAFKGHRYRATGGNDGKWQIQLSPMQAGGPYTMEIRGANTIILHDILIGDVWLCSGQSNMVHQMRLHSVRYQEDIEKAHEPAIRHFGIPTTIALDSARRDLAGGAWRSATTSNVQDFSAVAYFFARSLYEKYHVPIGLINASVGGSPIEAWISEEGLQQFPDIAATVNHNKDTAYVNGLVRSMAAANAALPVPVDQGMAAALPWYTPSYQPIGWKPIGIPGYWEDQGLSNLDGTVWYRREIDVPASMCSQSAKVFLGRIVDADFLYVNGQLVGNTTYLYPQRRYPIPQGLLKPGRNLFVIRVINNTGKGGFVPDKPYALIAGKDTIDLKGEWTYKVGAVLPDNGNSRKLPSFNAQNQPTALYNAMLAPTQAYSIRGICWYQGESNTGRAAEYSRLQPALIADWRKKWGEVAFLFVQLPGFGDYRYSPGESSWAELRAAQASSLSIPKTGMAVAIDLGEWNDIHPDRKKEVGQRLALAAEHITYGDSIVYTGPVYQSMRNDGDTLVLSFGHTGSGLITSDGEEPQEFSIAGADGKWIWAHARIANDQIRLWNENVKMPKFVRYAWADDPVNPNLYNKEGLPATPFQTKSD